MPKRLVIQGVNDLSSQRPGLAKEWHPTNNLPNVAENTYWQSEKRAFWLCQKNDTHVWEAIISSRSRGHGCPYCSNLKVLRGYNDLETTHPDVAKLWDYSGNEGTKPYEINAGSNKKFAWICSKDKNHKWQAPPARLSKGGGCPTCSGKVADMGKTDFATTNPELANQWDSARNLPLTPQDVKGGSNKRVWWTCAKVHSWQASISSRVLAGRGCPYCTNQRVLSGFNDLGTTHPSVAESWSEKNSSLSSSEVTAGSDKSAWWKCAEGHDFLMSVNRRTSGSNCNICSGKRIQLGHNDLASKDPELAKEWNTEANFPVTPEQVTISSNKTVSWICKSNKKHIWTASPNQRKKHGCPFCAGRYVFAGESDLGTLHPSLHSELATDLNGQLDNGLLSPGSHKRVWWRCQKFENHVWRASIQNRTRKGYGCPICSNFQVMQGYNDLESKFPDLAKEWDNERNDGLLPSEVLFGSDRRVWWICSLDERHVWKIKVSDRTSRSAGCPVCKNVLIIPGVNDLKSMNSELATEWHPTKNLPLRPEQVGQGAHKSVWWACSNYPNHEWRAAISARLGGTKCPFCANQSVLAGFNDLATRSPEIAKDWHPTKNGDVDPSQVAPSANRKFWWVCVNDSSHQWMATPGSRLRGSNCPKCANSGYDSSRSGLFYFIENRNLGAYKVGITNPGRGPSRVAAWQKAGWLVLATYESEDGLLIVNLETNLLRWIRKELGFAPYLTESDMKPLGGWSETFSVESMSSQEFLEKLELEIKDLEKQ